MTFDHGVISAAEEILQPRWRFKINEVHVRAQTSARVSDVVRVRQTDNVESQPVNARNRLRNLPRNIQNAIFHSGASRDNTVAVSGDLRRQLVLTGFVKSFGKFNRRNPVVWEPVKRHFGRTIWAQISISEIFSQRFAGNDSFVAFFAFNSELEKVAFKNGVLEANFGRPIWRR